MSYLSGSAPGRAGAVRAQRLSYSECQAWLSSHHEGRLGYQTGRGPRSVVVTYAMADDQIMFQLPDYNDIVHYAPGEQVTLEVDGTGSSAAEPEKVSVTGTARVVDREQTPVVRKAHFEESWPSDVATSVICLPMTDVQGIHGTF